MTLSIQVGAETISAPTGRNASGCIWLALNERAFPAEGWDDFVVVILEWWVAALTRLLSGATSTETVDFMEGPYAVELDLPRPNLLRATTTQRGHSGSTSLVGEEDLRKFAADVLVKGRGVLAACQRLGWESRDRNRLEQSLAGLEAALGEPH